MTSPRPDFCAAPSAPLRGRLRSDSLRSPLLRLPRRGAEQTAAYQITERNLHSPSSRAAFAFFPSALRDPIMEAGADRRLLRLIYDGVQRNVEPYSLTYKQRKDGHREEYFYVWDRTGGRQSDPGIKALRNHKISQLEVTEERFEPRYPIELGKAGELLGSGYFGGSGFVGSRRFPGLRTTLRHGWRYTIECSYCSRRFKRMTRNTILKHHNDQYGNECFGRRGVVVDQELI